MLSYIVSNGICAIVMTSLWLQNRRRFSSGALGFWLGDFVMQFMALVLIALRGLAPDFASILIANVLIIGGTLLLYMGLERYAGKTSSQRYNFLLLAAFTIVHAYFTYVQPSLPARNLNASVGLLVVCLQCAWLMLRRADAEIKPDTRPVGVAFGIYCLVITARICVELALPQANDIFQFGLFDTLAIVAYQMLFIALTFALFLMVNHRLVADLERDNAARRQAEELINAQNEELQAQNEELVLQSRVLRQAQSDLHELNSELEQRVANRTAELSLANVELSRAARLKDEFLASMSHELRTPLTGILGLSETLQMGVYGALTKKQNEVLKAVYESGQHLLELINDILDLSKIEAGKMELQTERILVADVCLASVQFVKPSAQHKNLRLVTSLDAQVTAIAADGRRLKQILVNLLSNAVKFTPDGGEIGLSVQGDPVHQVARFTVWDTGIGIAQADVQRLFQPFVQLDSRLAREYSGTGLGLSVVRRLAELHGGSVTLESAGVPGKGSRFTVALPWQEAEVPADISQRGALADLQTPPRSTHGADQGTAQSAQVVGGATRPPILLADDNDAVVMTLGGFLKARDYPVVVARNGAEAVASAQQYRPGLILIGVQMPGGDGLEAIRRLRADPDADLAATPIIASTALARPGDREQCLEAGANEYLPKPMNLARLVDLMDKLLNGPETAAKTGPGEPSSRDLGRGEIC